MKINIVSLLSFLSIVSTSEGFTPSSCVSHWNSPTAFTITTHIQSLSSKRGGNECVLRMAEDDEVEVTDPLNEGVESVSWLPSLKEQPTSSSETPEGAEVLPFFPLGGIVYTPNSEHVLNIFEPRYRKMYTDILMNGSKRFVVAMSHPTKEGTFAEVGVIFHLDDLKEVSEQTNDQIKYICTHSVTGRVKLHRVLNPEAWSSRETYLKVEGTIIDEGDEDDDSTEQKTDEVPTDIYTSLMQSQRGSVPGEKKLQKTFKGLVQRQHELEEDVRFTRASVTNLAVSKGDGDNGLWMTVRLWQSFIEQRLVARQNEMQRDFQEKLIQFLKKEKGVNDDELPSAIGFEDLSPSLQQEVTELQLAMTKELKPLILESTLTIQKLLEAEGHEDRLSLLNYFMNAEKKRLDAKKTLQGMFTGLSTAVTTESTQDDIKEDETSKLKEEESKSSDDDTGSSPTSIMTDEPDAFQ